MAVYTTQSEIQKYLPPDAVTDFADHDADGSADSGVVTEAIATASAELDLYLRQRYTATAIASSSLVAGWATRLAAYYLITNRGMEAPESLLRLYDRLFGSDGQGGLLQKIADGKMQIPDIGLAQDRRPSFSNLQVDRRFKHETIRVVQPTSSDSPTTLDQDFASDNNGP